MSCQIKTTIVIIYCCLSFYLVFNFKLSIWDLPATSLHPHSRLIAPGTPTLHSTTRPSYLSLFLLFHPVFPGNSELKQDYLLLGKVLFIKTKWESPPFNDGLTDHNATGGNTTMLNTCYGIQELNIELFFGRIEKR